MKDTLGSRMKFGIIIPSTNTTVQPEMDAMRPDGVTNQIGRIPMDNLRFDNDDDFEKIVRISSTVDEAALTLMTCEVDHFIMGVAPDAFWEGENAGENLKKIIREKTGLEMTVASDAMLAAFVAYGGIKRIAVIAPFTPDRDITAFYKTNGYDGAGCRRGREVARQAGDFGKCGHLLACASDQRDRRPGAGARNATRTKIDTRPHVA